MRTRIGAGAPAAAVLVLVSCAHGSQTYVDPDMDLGAIRTVAVLPFTNLSRDQQASERVRDVFTTHLLATHGVYVVPYGEVARALAKAAVANPSAPTVEEVQKLGTMLKADAVVIGTLKEYGEIRSGAVSANAISLSMQLQETGSGKIVGAGATTKGGVGMSDRLFGSGGAPLNEVTDAAVADLLDQLFR